MSFASSTDPPDVVVDEVVDRALREDLAPLGDITSALLPAGAFGRGALVSRASGVLAGRSCASRTFTRVSAAVVLHWHVADGDKLSDGTKLADLEGPLAALLSAERVALNFLCHLSGIATLTRAFTDAVKAANPATEVWDTRKTTPGLRVLEKAAVRAGGGRNHRANLSDAVLIKDNHLVGLSIAEAVARARHSWPGRMVEVECERLGQVQEAAAAGATVVMLDNMDPGAAEQAVRMARKFGPPGLRVEASGGVTLASAPAFARAGVDLVSVGAITQSAPALDIGLDLEG